MLNKIITAVFCILLLTSKDSLSSEFTGIEHFQQNRPLIGELLSDGAPTELHFFWTTTRTVEDLSTEVPVVQVGGAKYGQKFPAYVNQLILTSPDNLKIKFVCDEQTKASNIKWIEGLQTDHKERFEVIDVQSVCGNLIETLPEHQEFLKCVFQNATKGNPAITSDVYRLIGMLYGRNLEDLTPQETVYTYCDVDTFCAGMDLPNSEVKTRMGFLGFNDGKYIELGGERPKFGQITSTQPVNGHTNLLKALLSRPILEKPKQKVGIFFFSNPHDPTTSFYLGRRDDDDGKTNELIKLQIIDLAKYKSFCGAVLKEVISLDVKYKDNSHSRLGYLNYFPTLYNAIRTCEQDAGILFETYLKEMKASPLWLKDIIDVTGPGLTKVLPQCLPLGQPFPKISTWTWHGAQELEFVSSSQQLMGLTCKDQEARETFRELFSQYAGRVKDAFFSKRFGESHPFNIKMKQYLIENFPYNQQVFKDIFKSAWEKDRKTNKSTFSSWTRMQVKAMTSKTRDDIRDSHFCFVLMQVLERLGINIQLEIE